MAYKNIAGNHYGQLTAIELDEELTKKKENLLEMSMYLWASEVYKNGRFVLRTKYFLWNVP